MGELKNCSLKKMYFKSLVSKDMINKKRFLLTSMNKKSFLQDAPKYVEILQKKVKIFL